MGSALSYQDLPRLFVKEVAKNFEAQYKDNRTTNCGNPTEPMEGGREEKAKHLPTNVNGEQRSDCTK
jgi:hypothetical protein